MAKWPFTLARHVPAASKNNPAPQRRTVSLSREFLATACTARAKNLAATRGRFAREKPVPTGTHEIAGLESPLHIILE